MVCRTHDHFSCSNCPHICPKCSAQRSTLHHLGNYYDTATTSATATGPPRHHISPSSTRGDPVLASHARQHESPYHSQSTSVTDRGLHVFDQYGYPVNNPYPAHQRAHDTSASPRQPSASVTGQKLRSPDGRKRRPIPIPHTGRQEAHNAYHGMDRLGCSPCPEIGHNVDRLMAQLGINTSPAVSCSPIFTRPNYVWKLTTCVGKMQPSSPYSQNTNSPNAFAWSEPVNLPYANATERQSMSYSSQGPDVFDSVETGDFLNDIISIEKEKFLH